METKKIIAIGFGVFVVIIIVIFGLYYSGKINIGTKQQVNVVDCAYTENISTCDSTTGKKTITRTITKQNSNGGKECPLLEEKVNCDVNCVVSDWTQFSECSSDGTRQRSRTIVTNPLNKGVSCPPLTETENCKITLCDNNLPANYKISCPVGKTLKVNNAKYYRPPDSTCLLMTTDANQVANGVTPQFSENTGQSWYKTCEGQDVTNQLQTHINANGGNLAMPINKNYGSYNIGGVAAIMGPLGGVDICRGRVKQLDVEYTCI